MPWLDDIKDRKVLQWVLAYGAGAWVVAQVAEVITDPWGLPPAWIRTLHLLLVAGVPVTAVLAWYHGASGRQGFRRGEVFMLAAIMLVTLGVFSRLGPYPVEPAPTATGPVAGPVAEAAEHALLIDIPKDLPRLAVLGFTNLGRAEDAFFAEGITAELASRLSGLKKLAVISPNSARSWDPQVQGASAFGRILGADFVLSGTVVWDAGDNVLSVRVMPSLVRVDDDTQVWSDRIERAFDDALTLQAEIAARVTDKLAISLSQAERTALRGVVTDNPLAYETYLRALQVLPQGHGAEQDYRAALRLLTQVTTLDPEFLEAWTALADVHFGLYWFGYDMQAERLELGRAALEKAIALGPESDEVRMRQADYLYRQRKFEAALEQFSTLYADRPNDAEVLQHLGYIWRRQGLFEPGIEALERSVTLDPLNTYLAVELAWTYLFTGKAERTLSLAERALQQDPEAEWTPLMMVAACWTGGGQEALSCARGYLEGATNPTSTYPAYFWLLQLTFEGDLEGALLLAENYPDETFIGQAFWIPRDLVRGALLMSLGRELEGLPLVNQAAETLRQAIEQNPEDFRLYLSLARAMAYMGQPQEAVTLAQQGAALIPVERDALVGPEVLYALAEVYGLVGAEQQALDLMAKMMKTPTFHRGIWWTHNPAFASLQDTPRFKAMTAQVSN